MKLNRQLLTLAALAWIASTVSFVSAATGCLGTGTQCSTNTTITVKINPGDVCIGSTGAFDFGQYTIASTSQTVNGTFTSEFWVEDLKWSDTGYYTTVQMSGNLQGPGSSNISSGNVSMRTASVGNAGITLMGGSANTNVVIDSAMSSYQTLNAPRTLIKRNNGANFGLIGKYGVNPEMQLIIPAYQAVGQYTGTLVYTLYNN